METRIAELKEMAQKRMETFLSERAKQEMRINEWGQKISKVPTTLLEDIQLPEVITLQALVPEAYAEYPRVEVYVAQVNALNALIAKVNALAERYLLEAEREVAEYTDFANAKI